MTTNGTKENDCVNCAFPRARAPFDRRVGAAPSTPRAARTARGFTLVELLVVIAVIGILVGLVSSLVGGLVGHSRDSLARDLCSQAADAWTIVAITQGRLPGSELVEAVTDCQDMGGDFAVRMTPSAIVLLNDWFKTSPLPLVDVSKFTVRVGKTDHPAYEDAIEFGCKENGHGGSKQWRMEPETDQLRWGLFAPWVRRRIREEADDADPDSPLADPKSSEFETAIWKKTAGGDGDWGHGIVTVALDMDGDGVITIPTGMIDNKEELHLRATAVAWVWDEKKTKTLRSW